MRYPVKTFRVPLSMRTGTCTCTSRYDVLSTSYISSLRWISWAPRSKNALTDSIGVMGGATAATLLPASGCCVQGLIAGGSGAVGSCRRRVSTDVEYFTARSGFPAPSTRSTAPRDDKHSVLPPPATPGFGFVTRQRASVPAIVLCAIEKE